MNRLILVALLATGLAVFASPSQAQSSAALQVPPVADPTSRLTSPHSATLLAGVAGDVVSQSAIGFDDPFGVTVDTQLNRVIVTSLFTFQFEVFDLALASQGLLASPVVNVSTGVAYKESDDTFWWIDFDNTPAAAHSLIQTNSAFAVQNIVPLQGMFAQFIPGGLAYSSVNDRLWINDIQNDVYYEVDLTGTPTGSFFLNPDDDPPGTGAFGNGIATVANGALFDVPAGTVGEAMVTRSYRVDAIGTDFSSTDYINLINLGETFINGVSWHATGSMGLEVNYVVGNATATIFEVEMTAGGTPCTYAQISGFSCSIVGDDANLSWDTNAAYTSITVRRNGGLIATLAGGATSFTDSTAGAGLHEWTLETTIAGEICGGGVCQDTIYGVGLARGSFGGLGGAFGIAIDENSDQVFVTALDDGFMAVYDRDLNSLGTTSLPGMTPGDQATGITWDPASDTLYYLNTTAGILVNMQTDGTLISTFPIASPTGGLLGGMTINVAGDGLLVLDIVDDTYYEFDFVGGVTGLSFTSPGIALAGSLGNGVALDAAGVGYDLAIGIIGVTTTGGPDRVTNVEALGLPLGCEEFIGSTSTSFVDDDFVNGIVNTNSGPGGAAGSHRYYVGNAGDEIIAAPSDCTPCAPISAITCAAVGSDVDFTWTLPGGAALQDITITRDGVVVDVVAGSETSYTEVGVPDGQYVYVLTNNCIGGATFDVYCDVIVANVTAGTTDLVLDLEIHVLGTTGDNSTAIMDELVAVPLNSYKINFLDNVDLTGIERIWISCGIFPNNLPLLAIEGEILRDFALAGGDIFVSGGDIWGFDAATLLNDVDGIDLANVLDGPEVCDVASVTGVATTLGLDLSVAGTGAYAGECAWIDELAINPIAGIEVAQNRDAAGAPTAVYHNGVMSGSGDFHVISTSLEVLGQADVPGYISEILTAFGVGVGPTDPIFKRGDVNSDGGVNIADAVALLNFLFVLGTAPIVCNDAGDTNDDGAVNIADAVSLLNALFVLGTPPIPAPGITDCGIDPLPADTVDCLAYAGCP